MARALKPGALLAWLLAWSAIDAVICDHEGHRGVSGLGDVFAGSSRQPSFAADSLEGASGSDGTGIMLNSMAQSRRLMGEAAKGAVPAPPMPEGCSIRIAFVNAVPFHFEIVGGFLHVLREYKVRSVRIVTMCGLAGT